MGAFLVAALVPLATFVGTFLAEGSIPHCIQQYVAKHGMWNFLLLIAQKPETIFLFLFTFRYLRLVVHVFCFHCLYSPTPIPKQPTINPSDVTVIIPTVDPENKDFIPCLTSCLRAKPGKIIIVTVGQGLRRKTRKIVNRNFAEEFYQQYLENTIAVEMTNEANKRRQVAHALRSIKPEGIVVLLDDHVLWPSENFLQHLLAPFEDEKVGLVGTQKRVIRAENAGWGSKAILNMLGAIYLERHNFEIRATNAIDGGVFVVSGRTSAIRACIATDPDFLDGFTNERFLFGLCGPLNPDDDNFITRWVVRHGWNIKIQYSREAMIQTTLGVDGWNKFLSQCLRWVRTTWRSNSCSLFTDGTVLYRQPWCVYAVFVTSFFNFALFYDAALIYSLMQTSFYHHHMVKMWHIMAIIFGSKMVKIVPYFWRNPDHLIFLPVQLAFAYYHSLIKLWALFTFWNHHWGGRNLAGATTADDLDAADSDDSSSDDSTYYPGSSNSDDVEHNFGTDSRSSERCAHGQGSFPTPTDWVCNGSCKDVKTYSSSRTPLPKQQKGNRIQTPWGPVSPNNLHLKSANVRQGSLSRTPSLISNRSSRSSTNASTSTTSFMKRLRSRNSPAKPLGPKTMISPPSSASRKPIPDLNVALTPLSSLLTDFPPFFPADSPIKSRDTTPTYLDLDSPPTSPVTPPPTRPQYLTPVSLRSAKDRLEPEARPVYMHALAPPPPPPVPLYVKQTSPPFVYSRTFAREPTCGSIHADSADLGSSSSGCVAPSVWERNIAFVVSGRPRF